MSPSDPSEPEPALPAGLVHQRASESVAVASARSGSARLLFAHAGGPDAVEVIHGSVAAGEDLHLVPGDGVATELYLLLNGELRYELPGGTRAVQAGDRLLTPGLQEPVVLTATEPTDFLLVSFGPVFHQISDEIQQLRRLATEVELRDGYTADHCLRIQRHARATGRALGLSHNELHNLDYGAYLHDLGKLQIPLSILRKPGPLDAREWEVVRRHPVAGSVRIEATFMAAAAPIVAQHHERIDGSGYPLGLTGDEILPSAAIVAVVDSYDAMTSDRPYRSALSPVEAIADLRRLAGHRYPREVVDAFVSTLEQDGRR